MPRSNPFVERRRNEVMRILQLQGEVKVNYLAEVLKVSALTIRRDLDYLEEHGMIQRNYGVATLLNPASGDFSSTEVQAKTAIAKAAAAQVRDQETILLNTSSTALLILRYLKAKNVTVITNNAQAVNLPLPPTLNVILTGGELRIPKEAMVGEFALENLKHVRADRAFIGCSGLSIQNGMSTAVMQEAPINAAMIDHARQLVVVADHTKLEVTSNFSYAPIQRVHQLITDDYPTCRAFYKNYESMGIRVETVPSLSLREWVRDQHPRRHKR